MTVVAIERLDFAFAPRPWAFAERRRDDIVAHFAARQAKTPELWNGRVLLLNEWQLDETALRGTFFETDFADFLAWRDWGFPEAGATNCFSMGALRSSDGAYLLGVMAPHTSNPGRVYFPAGTPDPEDIVGDTVDLAANVIREVAEETGLHAQDFTVAPGWLAVLTGPRIALMKTLDVAAPAEDIRARVREHLAHDKHPELADMRIVRGPGDLDASMPNFVTTFLSHVWGSRT
jgi:8-oxo-dGTP pyrophosphatase MutT (NUDIX family)